MIERPILFSAPMVHALLNCTKSQTRRLVKPQPINSHVNPPSYEDNEAGDIFICPDLLYPNTRVFVEYEGGGRYHNMGADVFTKKHCPYGQPGDRLWVREAHSIRVLPSAATHDGFIWYRESDIGRKWDGEVRWKPSIHMPRWASRILLEIVGVRVERLQDISEADAIAEGISSLTGEKTVYHFEFPNPLPQFAVSGYRTAKDAYSVLWESINGPGSWAANPWVWVVEFKRVAP